MGDYLRHSALLVLDMQNDSVGPAGSIYIRGAEGLVSYINQCISDAQEQQAPVLYSQEWLPPDSPHFDIWPAHCVAGSWGAELAEGLFIDTGSVVRREPGKKDYHSAFATREPDSRALVATGLDRLLREREIRRLVIVGISLDHAVATTARDARGLGYVVDVDLAGTLARDADTASLERLRAELADSGVRFI